MVKVLFPLKNKKKDKKKEKAKKRNGWLRVDKVNAEKFTKIR